MASYDPQQHRPRMRAADTGAPVDGLLGSTVTDATARLLDASEADTGESNYGHDAQIHDLVAIRAARKAESRRVLRMRVASGVAAVSVVAGLVVARRRR